MKIITVTCFAKSEKRSELIALCKSMIAPSKAEAGCIQYNFYQDVSDKNKFFFYEEWKDQSAIDFHFATDHFISFQPKFAAMITDEVDLKIHTTS